ncbi:MAG: hypothetical protein ACE5G8_01290 [Anaerolineae bacterium]
MKRLFAVASILLLLFLFALPAQAQGPDFGAEAGRVVFGSNLTLEEGDLIDGDVVVFGGNFVMEPGSEVKGDVVVFGGGVTLGGKVKGNVVGIGGNVTVEPEAVVKGDIAGMGGQITVDESADVSGTVTNGPQFNFADGGFSIKLPTAPTPPAAPRSPETPPQPPQPRVDVRPESRPSFVRQVGRFVGDGIEDIFAALVIAGLSALIVLFFPAHTKTVQQTLAGAGPVSFVLGVITMLASVFLLVLLGLFFWLILPICGIVLVSLALAAALLTGLAVIGRLLGARVFAAFNNPAAGDLSATLLGVALLMLVIRMPFVDHLPWIGWMFAFVGGLTGFLVGSAGLGAVVLSRFGTQVYRGPSGAVPPPPSPPPAPPPPSPPAGDEPA